MLTGSAGSGKSTALRELAARRDDNVRVAAVPGSSFCSRPELGQAKLRFLPQQETRHTPRSRRLSSTSAIA
jgi:hypothetical protein